MAGLKLNEPKDRLIEFDRLLSMRRTNLVAV
jgi:hypothetical protein